MERISFVLFIFEPIFSALDAHGSVRVMIIFEPIMTIS